MLKRTVPSGGGFRLSTEFLPEKKGDGAQGGHNGLDGQRLDGAIGGGSVGDNGLQRDRAKEKR